MNISETNDSVTSDTDIDDVLDDRFRIPPRNVYQLVRRIKTLEKQRYSKNFQFYDPDIGVMDGEEERMRHDRALREKRVRLRKVIATARFGVEEDEHGELVPRQQSHQEEHEDRHQPNIPVGVLGFLRSFLLGHHIQAENERLRALEDFREQNVALARRSIHDTIQRYNEIGDTGYQLILCGPIQNGPRHDLAIDHWRVTLRRIFFAVLGVLSAVALALIHSFPLFDITSSFLQVDSSRKVSSLERELFDLRDLQTHIKYCGKDLNRSESIYWYDRSSCSSGVLHLQPLEDIRRQIADMSGEMKNRNSYVKVQETNYIRLHRMRFKEGFNHTWKLDDCVSSQSKHNDTLLCFRGVHDGLIQIDETREVLSLGINLIDNGGHHDQIYNNTEVLMNNAPSVYFKLLNLLKSQYDLKNIQPVAFRIYSTHAVVPTARLVGKETHLDTVLSRTINWEEVDSSNKFMTYEKRCILNADRQYRSDFKVHTQVYLTSSKHFDGGSTFFLDNTYPRYFSFGKNNFNGLLVDGEVGRITVNSGGIENRRCRLPVISGIRSVLQVWWDTP